VSRRRPLSLGRAFVYGSMFNRHPPGYYGDPEDDEDDEGGIDADDFTEPDAPEKREPRTTGAAQ
jgi:hypothetical protein